MKTIYIKFRHPDDVYAIHPDYDLDESTCSRCGESLYIPVELPESAIIVKPIETMYLEKPNIIPINKPEFMTIEFTPEDKLSFDEQERLKKFSGVSYVNEGIWGMLIDGFSGEPIKHKCGDIFNVIGE